MLVLRHLIATVIILTALGCGPQPEPPCPTKGWVSDRCAPMGEFRYGETVLKIPNTPPNQFRWTGGVEFDKKSRQLSSPGFAMYWRTGRPAGNGKWPIPAEDLVLFNLNYLAASPNQTSFTADRTGRYASLDETAESLAWVRPPGLLYVANSMLPLGKFKSFVGPSIENIEIEVSCHLLESHVPRRKVFCSGQFFHEPGLQVGFTTQSENLPSWRELVAALNSTINSWRTRADDAAFDLLRDVHEGDWGQLALGADDDVDVGEERPTNESEKAPSRGLR